MNELFEIIEFNEKWLNKKFYDEDYNSVCREINNFKNNDFDYIGHYPELIERNLDTIEFQKLDRKMKLQKLLKKCL